MPISYTELEAALRDMKPRQKIYELVRAEMKRRGRWKTLARGKRFMLGFDPRRQSKP